MLLLIGNVETDINVRLPITSVCATIRTYVVHYVVAVENAMVVQLFLGLPRWVLQIFAQLSQSIRLSRRYELL